MPNMMRPSSGLMIHMSTDARGSGINRETIADSKTNMPIQWAMKSHIRFIFSVFWLQSYIILWKSCTFAGEK